MSDHTIGEIKRQVCTSFGIDLSTVALMYLGLVLNESVTVSYANIPENAQLFLVPYGVAFPKPTVRVSKVSHIPAMSKGLEQNVLGPSLIRTRTRLEFWSRVATSTYVATVLASAALYVASTFLSVASPFRHPLVLSGFTFVSAYLVYKVWRKVQE